MQQHQHASPLKIRVYDHLTNSFFKNKADRLGNVTELLFSQEGEIYIRERVADENGQIVSDTLMHELNLQHASLPGPRFERTTYTGIRDCNQKKYYYNDIVCFTSNEGQKSYGVIVWAGAHLGIGSGKIGEYHAIDSITEKELREAEKAGNIYEHAYLINGEI